ncbi:MAG TPA: hypothetical protein VIY73_08495, partial [Polyangiaceae bacterium]
SATASASASAAPSVPSLACRSLDVRTAEARSEFPGARFATVDGTFLLVDAEHGPLFADVVRLAPQVLSALRHDRIATRPLCPVSVYVFTTLAGFQKHCSGRHYVPSSGREYGIYDPVRGEIVTEVSGGRDYVPTCFHEVAHVLMDADWDAGDRDAGDARGAPLWFRECVASLYESPVVTATEIHGTDDWRYVPLRPAVRMHDPAARMGALFGMSDATFRGKIEGGGTDDRATALHRATARATCQWLDSRGELWPLYRGWRDGRDADPDGVATFTRVTGHAPTDADAENAWRTWLLRPR